MQSIEKTQQGQNFIHYHHCHYILQEHTVKTQFTLGSYLVNLSTIIFLDLISEVSCPVSTYSLSSNVIVEFQEKNQREWETWYRIEEANTKAPCIC